LHGRSEWPSPDWATFREPKAPFILEIINKFINALLVKLTVSKAAFLVPGLYEKASLRLAVTNAPQKRGAGLPAHVSHAPFKKVDPPKSTCQER
jgi:hypothetical protein